MGFIIVAIIIFALIQRRRYRRMSCSRDFDKWSRKWDRYMRRYDRRADAARRHASDHWSNWSKDVEDWGRSEWKEFKDWSHRQDWKSGAKDIEAAARDFQRKLRETIDREAHKFSGKSDVAPDEAPAPAPEAPPRASASNAKSNEEPHFKSDEERRDLKPRRPRHLVRDPPIVAAKKHLHR